MYQITRQIKYISLLLYILSLVRFFVSFMNLLLGLVCRSENLAKNKLAKEKLCCMGGNWLIEELCRCENWWCSSRVGINRFNFLRNWGNYNLSKNKKTQNNILQQKQILHKLAMLCAFFIFRNRARVSLGCFLVGRRYKLLKK